MNNCIRTVGAALFAAVVVSLADSTSAADSTWLDRAVSPVVNPLFFEDPHINSEVRPIFAYHNISDDFLAGPGFVRYYAVQLRYAVNDRLAIIATKDGYIDTHFSEAPSLSDEGWANLGFGVKYALIKDEANQFILTPGLKLEVPTGNQDVFQGTGAGEWDLFVSAAKSWDRFRVLGNAGFRIPNDFSEQTAQAHYSLQAEYFTCRWFIPFVAVNGFTVLSEGKNPIPLDVEGFDLINFGSPDAGGFTQIVVGAGFRSRVWKHADIGFGYEKSVTRPRGLFDDRFTVDFILHF
jgi:hypothetical protein